MTTSVRPTSASVEEAVQNLRQTHVIPDGLVDLTRDMSRQIFYHRPENVAGFLADYLEGRIRIESLRAQGLNPNDPYSYAYPRGDGCQNIIGETMLPDGTWYNNLLVGLNCLDEQQLAALSRAGANGVVVVNDVQGLGGVNVDMKTKLEEKRAKAADERFEQLKGEYYLPQGFALMGSDLTGTEVNFVPDKLNPGIQGQGGPCVKRPPQGPGSLAGQPPRPPCIERPRSISGNAPTPAPAPGFASQGQIQRNFPGQASGIRIPERVGKENGGGQGQGQWQPFRCQGQPAQMVGLQSQMQMQPGPMVRPQGQGQCIDPAIGQPRFQGQGQPSQMAIPQRQSQGQCIDPTTGQLRFQGQVQPSQVAVSKPQGQGQCVDRATGQVRMQGQLGSFQPQMQPGYLGGPQPQGQCIDRGTGQLRYEGQQMQSGQMVGFRSQGHVQPGPLVRPQGQGQCIDPATGQLRFQGQQMQPVPQGQGQGQCIDPTTGQLRFQSPEQSRQMAGDPSLIGCDPSQGQLQQQPSQMSSIQGGLSVSQSQNEIAPVNPSQLRCEELAQMKNQARDQEEMLEYCRNLLGLIPGGENDPNASKSQADISKNPSEAGISVSTAISSQNLENPSVQPSQSQSALGQSQGQSQPQQSQSLANLIPPAYLNALEDLVADPRTKYVVLGVSGAVLGLVTGYYILRGLFGLGEGGGGRGAWIYAGRNFCVAPRTVQAAAAGCQACASAGGPP